MQHSLNASRCNFTNEPLRTQKYVCICIVLLHKGAIWQMEPLCTLKICVFYTLISYIQCWKQKRRIEGCSKFKSPETRQVQERLVSTLEHMQVPKWDWTRYPEEQTSSVHATPVAYVLWKPCTIRWKVKFGNKVQISNGQYWCYVLSMEGVTVCDHHPECRVIFGRGRPHIVW